MITKATPLQAAAPSLSLPCQTALLPLLFSDIFSNQSYFSESRARSDPDRSGEASTEKGRAWAELTFVMLLLGMCFGSFRVQTITRMAKAASMSVGRAKLL